MDLGSGEMQITLRDDTTKSYTAPSVSWLYEDIKPYVDAYNAQHPDDHIEFDLKRTGRNFLDYEFLTDHSAVCGHDCVLVVHHEKDGRRNGSRRRPNEFWQS